MSFPHRRLVGGIPAGSNFNCFLPFLRFRGCKSRKKPPGFEGRKNLRYCRGLRIQTKHFHFLYSNPEISANSTNFHYKPSLATEKTFTVRSLYPNSENFRIFRFYKGRSQSLNVTSSHLLK